MSILSEIEKLSKVKTSIRKTLQRKNSGIQLSTIFPQYYTYIKNMSDIRNPDETGILDYVEDRVNFLEISVNKIRQYAFRQYTCLLGLYLNNSEIVTLENINAFTGCNTRIYVPNNLLTQYKQADNWSEISGRIYSYNDFIQDSMYLIEGLDKVKTLEWIQGKTLEEIIKDFR